ncbi:uncharacterized protein FIBRA_07562 [Fibroporia radiculosa]|uniref:Protein kinase domain-containing protein n=1 Tax=Fibroporia radiculosa TaxID=599839 RepID=J4GEW7_9APHY|nr:uncharacterized protein FIBRA_07562 [Fibroporia radiculosa]CCM05348.1 predicted protein [Fibroporia radiculosa]
MGEPVTPKKSQKPLETHSDTPFVHKAARSISHLNESLPASRQTVLGDLGASIPEVSVAFFFESVCPRITSRVDSLVDKVVSRLTKGSNNIIDDETGRWVDFAISPGESSKGEDPTFKPLENLVRAIGDAASAEDSDFTCNLMFENSPYVSPASDHWNSSSRPDGYFRARGMGDEQKPHWKDIALSAEYKKYTQNETRDDVVSKVIWGMHHSMREDPRRRFTFGLTVEDHEMRLWYASRADVMVTRPFDFLTDHRSVVHLALAFLSSGSQDAGWDPTMKALVDDNGDALLDIDDRPRFEMTVREEDGSEVIFRTTRLISFIGTAAMQGRGTRVWEAKRVEDGQECGDSVVLKDCWVDDDRLREGTIIKMIRESDIGAEGRNVLDEHLLTIICHGDVRVDGDVVDHTRDLMTRGKEVSLKSGEFRLRTSRTSTQHAVNGENRSSRRSGTNRGSSSKRSSGRSGAKRGSNTAPKGTSSAGHHRAGESTLVQHHEYYQYHPRVHYRIVVKEVCTALHHEVSLFHIFKYLSQTATVLRFLHEAGWVHRDLSTGNILIFNGKIKLADFEYAKQVDIPSSHDIRTGTADFMAVEVDLQHYFFQGGQSVDTIGDFKQTYPITRGQRIHPPSESTARVFRYNPLHDFESLWWISVYFVANKKVERIDQKAPPFHRYQQQKSWAADIFYSLPGRKSALRVDEDFQLMIDSLSPGVRGIGDGINLLRKSLVKRYSRIEKDFSSVGRTAAGHIHEDFFELFDVIAQTTGEIIIGPLSQQDSVDKATVLATPLATRSEEPQVPKRASDIPVKGSAPKARAERRTEPNPRPFVQHEAQHRPFGTRIRRREGLPHPMQTRSKTRGLTLNETHQTEFL